MKKILSILFLFLLSTGALAQPCIYLFYGQGCSHCANVLPFVESLEIDMHKFEVYENRTNLVLMNKYFDAYQVEQRGVPVIFIGNEYLVGDTPILENLQEKLLEYPSGCPHLEVSNTTGTSGSMSPSEKLTSLSLITIISAALVDSINPCAIAVLLILLGALLSTGKRKRALKAGLAFSASIYISYFLFGLGLFSVIKFSGLSYWFYNIIGFIAIIIGLANIKDYFWYGGGGFVMEIPRKWRPKLKSFLRSITSPVGAFLSGFIVCLFELPCTGGPYIFILGLLAEQSTQAAAIPILALYNIFFVLPLVIISLLVYWGRTSIESASEWKEKNIRKIHLITGLVMLVLGAVVLLGIV